LTLEELEGNFLMRNKVRFLEKKKNINKILIEICLMKFPIPIPLCRMINMEVVHHALENDVALLVKSFANGYILGSTSFYVPLEHENGHVQKETEETHNTWDDVWKKKNEEFEEFLVENNLQ